MYSVSLRSNTSCCSAILKSRCQIPFNLHANDGGEVLKPLDPDDCPDIVFKKPAPPRPAPARNPVVSRQNENLLRFLRTAWENFMRDFEKEHKDGTNCTLCGGSNQADSVPTGNNCTGMMHDDGLLVCRCPVLQTSNLSTLKNGTWNVCCKR